MFWLITIPSLLVVGTIMGLLFRMAADVPDRAHLKRRFRLNPEVVRAIAYVIVIVICLVAAMYEISLYNDLPEP